MMIYPESPAGLYMVSASPTDNYIVIVITREGRAVPHLLLHDDGFPSIGREGRNAFCVSTLKVSCERG